MFRSKKEGGDNRAAVSVEECIWDNFASWGKGQTLWDFIGSFVLERPREELHCFEKKVSNNVDEKNAICPTRSK
jgi:hypothetical protein